jgi:hypothetical protein
LTILPLNKSDCAIILPVYNPPEDWYQVVIEQYSEFLQHVEGITTALVLANDGTEKNFLNYGIAEIRKLFPDLVVIENEKNEGKGNVLRKAVLATDADFFLLTDIDFPYNTESLLAVFNCLRLQKNDIAAGTRNNYYYSQIKTGRKYLSQVLRFCIRSLFQISIEDTQCGLKGFSEKAKPIFIKCKVNRYLYDLEFIVQAYKVKDLIISAVPVVLREGIYLRKINLKILMQEAKSFFNILKIRYSK